MGPIHGRAREQSALDDQLARALDGSPTLVLLSGEPGIGKTTLLEHLAARAEAVDAHVGWGACWDGDGSPTFWPWHRVVDGFAGLQAALPGEDPGHFTLFTTVADLLGAVDRPHLLVLDDLQWADPDCLRLLRFLARDLRGCPVLIAGSFRDVGLAPGHRLRELAVDSAAVRLHLALQGLTEEATAAVMADVTGTEPGVDLAARVRARTAGNPFFVREVALLSDSELTERLSGPVVDALGARVDCLPTPAREALDTAAVVGRDFEDEVVARANGTSTDDLHAALAPAVAGRLLEPAGTGRHRFVHDLVREHLVARLSPTAWRARNRAVHDALAETVDAPMRTSRLAEHAVRAVPALDPATAILRCEQAADDAEQRHLYDGAARHLRAAIGLASGATAVRRLRLAEDLRRAGQLGEARDRCTDLLADATDATVRARAALGLHEVGVVSTESRQPLIHALEQALADLGDTDDALAAELTAALARELADGPQRDEQRATALADRAVELARRHGDPTVLAACLFARHDVIWSPETAEDRADLGAELCRVAEADAPALAFQGALCRYVALLELASPTAEAALLEVEERAARLGQPVLQYLARSRRDAWDAMTGTPGLEERLAESWALGSRLEVPDASGVYITQAITLDLQGDDAPTAMQARRVRPGNGSGDRLMPPDFAAEERGFELLAAGDTEGAASVVAAAPAPAERAMFRWRALAAVAFQADLAWRTGAADVAARVYDWLRPHTGRLVVIGGGVAVLGPVDLFLGLAAATSGRPERAREHFRSALAQARLLGARPWVARIVVLLEPPSTPNVFRRDGAVWRLEYAGRVVHAPDSKGMADLATLLARPGEPVTALRLAGGDGAGPQLGSDPVLDDTARASYRRRLEQLDEEIDRAVLDGDDAARQAADDERSVLVAELTRAAGLGGRARRLGDPGERARSTVTARIRDTLTRIERQHPELGRHLRASVRTGRECVYAPETETRWGA
jgi:hypothetical protein